jgi:hypothetical protein
MIRSYSAPCAICETDQTENDKTADEEDECKNKGCDNRHANKILLHFYWKDVFDFTVNSGSVEQDGYGIDQKKSDG